jgi:hypothetical protein
VMEVQRGHGGASLSGGSLVQWRSIEVEVQQGWSCRANRISDDEEERRSCNIE